MKTLSKAGTVLVSRWLCSLACLFACFEGWAAEPVVIGVAQASVDVSETAAAVQISIGLQSTSTAPVTVDYHTADGTALAGAHYAAQAGTLVFGPGERTKTISVPIFDNAEVNPTRLFTLAFENPHGGYFAPYSPTVVYVYIRDNEKPNLVDATFQPGSGVEGYDETIGSVTAVLPQLDGKVFIGGDFNSVAGNLRKGVARLNADGSYDTNYNFGAGANGKVKALALQPNGQLLIGGEFLAVNSLDRTNIARLNADGTVDNAFKAVVDPDGTVYQLAVQPDGSVLVGGNFRKVNGSTRIGIARLLSNGNLDGSFQAPAITNLTVRGLAVLSDGKIMVAGNPTNVLDWTFTGPRILRLNSDGSVDPTFNPPYGPNDNDPINGLALQPDGKVIIFGRLHNFGGVYNTSVARLNTDGTLSTSFFAGSFDIQAVSIQPDGKILVAGGDKEQFSPDFGYSPQVFSRWNGDGTFDSNLPPGVVVDNPINAMALQADGRLVIGGSFTSVDNLYRVGIARIDLSSSSGNVLTFSKTKYEASEESGVVPIVIVRSGSSASARTVTFSTADGLARHGLDYIGQTNTITFAPLEVEKTVNLPLLDDGEVERDETVQLQLSNPSAGAEGGLQSLATLTIEQEERPVLLDISFDPGSGADRKIYAIARQPDGKTIIGGQFVRVNGINRRYIARLNADGSVDPTFDAGASGPSSYVRALALQADGKVIVGGEFNVLGSYYHAGVARLNSDGTVDTNFVGFVNGSREVVNAVALQPDGKILVAGNFYAANGRSCYNLARFCSDGSLDLEFIANNSSKPYLELASVALQSDGKILAGGYDQAALMRFATNGYWDRNFVPPSLAITNLSGSFPRYGRVKALQVLPNDKIVLGGLFRSPFQNIAKLNADGTLDPTFNPGLGANNSVNAIALDSDDKLVIGGEFFRYNDIASRRLARINGDGSLDLTFFPGKGANDEIQAILIQPDHKYVLGGEFSALNGINIDHIARIYGYPVAFNSLSWSDPDVKVNEGNLSQMLVLRRYGPATNAITASFSTTDLTAVSGEDYVAQSGTITLNPLQTVSGINLTINDDGIPEEDEQFQVGFAVSTRGVERGFNHVATVTIRDNETPLFQDNSLSRANVPVGTVNVITAQPDGKSLVGGLFTVAAGRANLMRMNPDGTTDFNFAVTGTDYEVRAIALQSNGQVIVGGNFTRVDNAPARYIARLSPGGVVDGTFEAATNLNAQVRAILVQPDQKIIIGGNFTLVGTNNRNRIARLLPDGTLDETFDPGTGANDRVRVIARQPDGRLIVAGRFTQLNGNVRNYVGRLIENGALDGSFSTEPNNEIRAVALQPDGKILIGGEFTKLGAVNRCYLARLNSDGTMDATFQDAIITNLFSTGFVGEVKVQPDGKILIGGLFNMVGGFYRPGVARLNADGSLDHRLFAGQGYPNYYGQTVNAIWLQTDGRVLLGGNAFFPQPYSGYAGLMRIFGDSVSQSGLELIQPNYNPGLVSEAVTNLVYTVRRIGNISGSASAGFTVGNGTATPGQDFSTESGTVAFGPFETEKTLAISLVDDDLAEQDETIVLSLNNPSANSVLNGTNAIIRILDNDRPGSRDTRFDAHVLVPGYSQVAQVIVQPDTNILIGGYFSFINGTPIAGLARLHPDATLDLTFFARLPSNLVQVTTLALQADGKILAGDGNQFFRLNSDGSSDESFPARNQYYRPFLAQPDGKIICQDSNSIMIRLTATGQMDPGFQAIDISDLVSQNIALALGHDGSLILGAGHLIRIYQPDGVLLTQLGLPLAIRTLLVEPGGSILAGGIVTSAENKFLLRITAGGVLDTSFSPDFAYGNPAVNKVLRQADGKLIVLGEFTSVNGVSRTRIARLNSDGTLDQSFDTGLSLQVLVGSYDNGGYTTYDNNYRMKDAALSPDGGVIIGGTYAFGYGDPAGTLVRLNGDLPLRLHRPIKISADQWSLNVDTMPGKKVVLESSTSLPVWTPISTNTVDAYYIPFNLPAAPGGKQFYRARQLP